MIGAVCNVPDVLKVLRLVKIVITIIKIVVPIILIIVCMIDYAKAVGSAEDMSQINKSIVRKIIAAILVFCVPTFIGIIFGLLDPNGKTYIGCLESATTEKIDSLYKETMDRLISNAENSKSFDDYNAAKSYLNNISDETLRKEYKDKLDNLEKQIVKENDSKSNNNNAIVPGQKYDLTLGEVAYLASVCICEQPTLDGIAAEASLMANLFEHQSKYKTLVDYVKNSGWFACKTNNEEGNTEQLQKVRDVLVNGNRTLPLNINEHDCYNCTNKTCENGNKGDICYLEIDGKILSSMSDIKNHSNYISGKTKIKNRYGSYYTFYTFPCDGCDPFGYTK